MGCDICTVVERYEAGRWRRLAGDLEIFEGRHYRLFGFLADVRNDSRSPSIAPGRGLPGDASPELQAEYEEWADEIHDVSWVRLIELLDHDYRRRFWDRRDLLPRLRSLRGFLGPRYFADLERLQRLGDPRRTRIVFWFQR